MKVELKQLAGRPVGEPDGPPIPQPVDRVILDGVQVATCSRHDGAPVCFIRPLLEETRKAVVAEVAKLRGEKGHKVSDKDVAMPAVPDELREIEDDEIQEDDDA